MLKTRLVESGNDAGSQLRVQRSTGRALVAVLALLAMQPALAGPIDLNLFYISPDGAVVIDSTGSSATMIEGAGGVVLLSNDPGLGDPVLINPSEGPNLRFQYAFNADCPLVCDALAVSLFSAIPGDSSTGGPSAGLLQYDVFTSSGIGEISYLLSAFNLAADQVFGLQFELLAYDDTINASAIISGLEVYDPAAVSVPEPGTLGLLLSGLAGMAVRRRCQPIWKSSPA
jgi:hypothetical protein